MSLLIQIDRYLRDKQMPVTKFGRLAANDPRLVTDLRHGRRIGPRLAARVQRFLTETGA